MSETWEKLISFENLYKAHRVARLGKRHKKEVVEFETLLGENLWRLHFDLRYNKYRVGGYHKFMIYDPKEREIQAITYRDRIIQHSLCDNYLTPLLEKHLIYDNAACRRNKGTDFAIKRLRYFMYDFKRKYGTDGYFIKIDIKKYFDSIDHYILKTKLKNLIDDTDIFNLICNIIDSYNSNRGKGLPMGNQSSQCFALLYLDRIDRFIKEVLRVKYYVRYMDDMILLITEKQKAQNYLIRIVQEITEERLIVNSKTQIIQMKNGISFLGWRFFYGKNGEVVQKILRQAKVRVMQKVNVKRKCLNKLYTSDDLLITLTSYNAHYSRGNSTQFLHRINDVLSKAS